MNTRRRKTMSWTMTIDIPALDRLCDWLETGSRAQLMAEIRDEIVTKLKDAAGDGTLEKAAKAPTAPPADIAKGEKETTSPAPDGAPSPKGEGKEVATAEPVKPVTLDMVQRAAAQMRDDGKLKEVTAMFPEFGIKKLSDLKGDALQGFADRLRELGAKI